MPDLNVFFSNRLEIIAEQLARIVGTPLSSPLTPEIIVVQSQGMERWISMELAKYNGISANCRFPFPNAFLQDLFKRFIPELPEPSPWDPDIMSFAIMKLLPACLDRPEFKNINAYLKEDANHLKLFQLSDKIADLFDQYLVFRPELVFSWEENNIPDDQIQSWQATLWRKLVEINGSMHRARFRKKLFDQLDAGSVEISYLPQRVSVFGISYLPLFHLETFAVLSNTIPINFFLLNPCKEYWTDIVSEKQHQRIRRKFPDTDDIAAELHFEEGNRLLASMGNLGKDFFHLLGNFNVEFHDLFDELPCHDMLSYIQADILTLRNRGPADPNDQSGPSTTPSPEESVQLKDWDNSIQVHSCHSPMREIEVLHDNLLAFFEEDPNLLPKDIIVMAPNIEMYAPYIHAVFDVQPNDSRRIPFSIADQTVRQESRLIDAFFSLLDLKDSRLTATQILRLLEYSSIKQTFAFSDADIQVFERWVGQTRIRWGKDVNHRLKFDLPRFSENTWSSGIKRLLLGYATPGYHRDMFEGILPYDEIEGNDTRILGSVTEFLERVFRCVKILEHPKTLGRWQKALHFILEHLFLPDEDTERDRQTLRKIFDELADRHNQTGLDEKLDFDVIRAYLGGRLDQKSFGSGYISRGVTFCSMLPMRSIPFKVMCLVGLDADAFPRDYQPLSFDIMARNARIGDRSRRNDDKYLFLESMMCARKKFYISYVGQNIQDNSRIPPSVLVSELLDLIEAGFYLPQKNIRDHVLTVHRLQAFSPSYFQGEAKLFSYCEENMLASNQSRYRREPDAFIAEKLVMSKEEFEEWKVVDIDTLCLFFSNPTRFLLEKRLGLFLGRKASMTEDRENFELSALQRYGIEQNLINSRLNGMEFNDFRPIQRSLGQLPPGMVGDCLYDEMSAGADSFVQQIEDYTREKVKVPLDFDYEISGFSLRGRLTDIYAPGYIHVRYANRKVKDLLKLWIYHLIYCEVKSENLPADSFLFCKDKAQKVSRPSNPGKILKELLELFRKGLAEPIHFFPETSFKYVQQIQNDENNRQSALNKAEYRWQGDEFKRGEIEDPYYRRCFENMDPIEGSFEEIAKRVYQPLLAHLTEIVV
jgi:exodeoxyribonuclease V gamma subunit